MKKFLQKILTLPPHLVAAVVVIAGTAAFTFAFTGPPEGCVPGKCTRELINGARVTTGTLAQTSLVTGTVKASTDTKSVIDMLDDHGYFQNCALLSNGQMKCWGWNNADFPLGIGNQTNNQYHPMTVPLENVKEIVKGGSLSHCAIKTDNTLWCWGDNANGEIGNGNTTDQPIPVQVLTNVKSAKLGASYTCAIKTDDTLWCWGYNGQGGLGVGDTTNRNTPTQITALTNVKSIEPANSIYRSTCAIKTDGSLWCWGYNGHGQLGIGDTTNRTAPMQVTSLSGVEKVKIAKGHYGNGDDFPTVCALLSDKTMRCWGNNGWGEIGDGSSTNRSTPVQVNNMENVLDFEMLDAGACARKLDGTVWCWGNNGYGQLGDGTTTNKTSPVQVQNLTDVAEIKSASRAYHVYSSGWQHYFYDNVCAVKTDGTVWCWGYNGTGQIGDGTTTNRNVPVKVEGIKDAKKLYSNISTSEAAMCVLTTNGKAKCWGYNAQGQLGRGDANSPGHPDYVLGLNLVD